METEIAAQTEPKKRGRKPGFRMGAQPQRTQQRLPQRAANWRPRRTIDEIEQTGRYYIPTEVIPDGMTYEWKTLTINGMEAREHQIRLARDGAWDAVPASRHPELVGKYLDSNDENQPIIVGGQILMERPAIYTAEAAAENLKAARDRVSGHFKSLGLNEGGGPPRAKPQVKMDYSTVSAVPDDEPGEAA